MKKSDYVSKFNRRGEKPHAPKELQDFRDAKAAPDKVLAEAVKESTYDTWQEALADLITKKQ